jgi:serine/threonine protein kinase
MKKMNSNIKNFYLNEQLGKGAYGSVFKVNIGEDENEDEETEYAIKQCRITSDLNNKNKEGIPSIMEPSIMSSIIHPCINNALDIYCSDEHIYILTLKAENDLGHYIRKNHVDMDTKLLWCYQISTGLACLHSQGIIHCDIKSGNVLLFRNDFDMLDAKLSDFTLAVKKHKKYQTYKHAVCTPTHKPLECLLGEGWDESLDIWSLGCTFFEIIYSRCLFPYQGEYIEQDKEKFGDKQAKIRQKRRTANCIMDWGNYCERKKQEQERKKQDQETYKLWDLEYKKPNIPQGFPNPDSQIDNLIYKMLSVESDERPNINEIVNDPVFDKCRDLKYKEFKIIVPSTCSKEEIKQSDIEEVESMIDFLEATEMNDETTDETTVESNKTREESASIIDKNVLKRALKIYKRTYTLKDIPNDIKFKTCLAIAIKIVIGYGVNNLDNKIIDAEKKICHYLSFRLHG